MRVLVGTSGYSYPEWKGSFYPADLKADAMLRWYAERLPTVEINNTFYRMPTAKLLGAWVEQVPDGFRFVLKGSRRITHLGRLKGIDDSVAYLFQTAGVLEEKRGPILFQLPPNFKKDFPRLQRFLELLPGGRSAAMEFRHPSWLEEDVFAALRRHNVALCVADTDEAPGEVVATADWGYLRLRREQYDEQALGRWAQRVAEQAWDEAFVFFKHEEAGAGPRLALRFRELAGD